MTRCGRICYQRRKINLSQVFAGQKVGMKQTADHIWLVSFMDYDLGYFDDETCRLEPIDDPWVETVTHVSGMSVTDVSGMNCYPCPRNELLPMSQEWTLHVVASPPGNGDKYERRLWATCGWWRRSSHERGALTNTVNQSTMPVSTNCRPPTSESDPLANKVPGI